MTSRPFTVRHDRRVQAVQAMIDWGAFRHVPVVDEHGFLVGIVSQTDVLRATASEFDPDMPPVERAQRLAGIRIDKVMTGDVLTVDREMPVAEAAGMMQQHRIDCLPVTERGRVVGIVTAFYLLGVVAQMPPEPVN